jgi:septal ring factor EnvC (AmiA/AmiB activator)
MTCSTAVFSLMMGATALSCAALYYYFKNITDSFKVKIKTFNTALANSQEERHSLKQKNENIYLENVAQTVEIEKLNEELLTLKNSLMQMEKDNRYLMREYSTLENQRTVFSVQRAPYNGQIPSANGQINMENGQFSNTLPS